MSGINKVLLLYSNLWWAINDGDVSPTGISSFLSFTINHNFTTSVSCHLKHTESNSEGTGQYTALTDDGEVRSKDI